MLPGITYYASAFCIMTLFAAGVRNKIDQNSFLIFFFSLSYGIFPLLAGFTNSPKNIICSIVPPAFYLYGRYLVEESKTEKALLTKMSFILILFALNTYVICISDIISTGQLVNVTRSMSRFRGFEEDQVMAATGFGINISLGLIGLAMFLREQHKSIRHYIYLFLFILSLLVTVHLVNRTGIILSIVVTVIILFLSLQSKNRRKLLWGVFFFAIIAYFLYVSGGAFSEVVDEYSNREDIEMNGGIFNTSSRSWRWIDGLGRLFTEPFGYADQMPSNYYVHNLWLDVSRWSGLLPFLLVFIITYKMTKKSWQSLRKYKSEFTYLVFGLCICSMLTFFIEPVIEGSAIYFYLFCMFWGMITQYNYSHSTATN